MVYKFNPTLVSPEELRKLMVAREPLIERLMKKIKESGISGSLRHYIIAGPRGIGKTHLLLLIYYSVKEEILKNWIPIKLSEEEYSINTIGDLFLRVLEELLEENYSKEDSDLLTKLKSSNEETIVEYSLEFMKNFRNKNKKRFLLLIDNLPLIFRQIGDEAQIGRLREILMKDDLFMIIGTAPTLFNQITDYNAPFYNFFEIENLSELSLEDSKSLILNQLEYDDIKGIKEKFEQYEPRVKAILHLTGGNPRLILMFYEIITEFGVLEIQEELKRLLDELTPYYQAKIEILPPQQRKIFDTLALMDGPATQTEIAEKTRISRNIVISQIKRLVELGYVRPARQKRKKYVLYEISEQLFRIWREMRTSREGKPKFLVMFLEVWYTPEELYEHSKKSTADYSKTCTKGDITQAKQIIYQSGCIEDAKLNNYDEALRSANKALLMAEENDKKEIPEVVILFVYLHANFNEYMKAEIYLRKLFEYGLDEKTLRRKLFSLITDLISCGLLEFTGNALKIIGEVKGKDYSELLKPFSIAVEYLKTKDDEILERLHPEMRGIVEEIIKKTGKNEKSQIS